MSLALIPALIAFLEIRHLGLASEEQAARLAKTYAYELTSSIADQFYERYGDAQTFALNPILQTGNSAAIGDYFNKVSALYGIYDLILFVGMDGRLKAVNTQGPDGKSIPTQGLINRNFKDSEWFKATVEGRLTEDAKKGLTGTFVEEPGFCPLASEVYGQKMYGNSFSTLVKDSKGNPIGVLSNHAGFRWVEDQLKGLYERMHAAKLHESELSMLSKDGAMLIDYRPFVNGGKLDVVHDPEVLNKYRPKDLKYEPALRLARGEAGLLTIPNPRTKVIQLVGFAPIQDHKFVDSLGWSVLVKVTRDEAIEEVSAVERSTLVVMAVVTVVAGLLSVFFSAWMTRVMVSVVERLTSSSTRVSQAADTIASTSQQLESTAGVQAAAIQETSASAEQLSANTQKNSENAALCRQTSEEARKSADDGQKAVQNMLHAIEEMSRSNQEIMTQVEAGNREISDIIKVINEISAKTAVINDIVFQTKLLSFNASVEAARAGEHGKGFAVVAEEVGNLAVMSGNAAKEISTMLDQSTRKVQSIVEATRTQVQSLMEVGKSKVDTGIETAKVCDSKLSEILQSVRRLDEMVVQIALSSNEQATGVGEISRAMTETDKVTQQNAQVSRQAATSAVQLREDSQTLANATEELSHLVWGRKAS